MTQTNIPRKLYITTLKFDTWQIKLYFEGEDSDYGREQFRQASISLNEIGDECSEWLEFLDRAIKQFKSYGFTRVDK